MNIFKDKYSTIANDWNLTKGVCTRIINKYTKKLEQELSDPTPVALPPHFKDRRTDKEYIFDIVEGWLVEDLVLAWIRHRVPGLTAGRSGKDADRLIQRLKHGKIGSRPDLYIRTPRAVKRLLEVQMSRIKDQPRFDIKTTKVDYLRRKGGCIIFILLEENKFFMLLGRHILQLGKKPEPNPCFGGKMTYCFTREDIEKIGLYRLDGDIPDEFCERIGIL